jgi:hypothetical protein
LVIHAAAKVDVWQARHFGLKPEALVTSAFVGVVNLTNVRPYTREDARLRGLPQNARRGRNDTCRNRRHWTFAQGTDTYPMDYEIFLAR